MPSLEKRARVLMQQFGLVSYQTNEPCDDDLRLVIDAFWGAVLAEREACAKWHESQRVEEIGPNFLAYSAEERWIIRRLNVLHEQSAAAIRARETP